MSNFSNVARSAMVTAMLIGLTGCGGGGGSDSPPPSSSPPPPAPAPPPPPPPPPPATPTPPIAATAVDISDGHAIGVGRPEWGDPRTDGTPKAGFDCVRNPPDTFQFRAHLSIMVNNELQRIPSRIGQARVADTHCFYPIHTDGDDASGRVHVEAPAAGTFTLGQFFEIWGQPLTNTNVAGVTGLPVEIHVTENGTVMKVEEADWGNIEFKSHREITIELGTPTTEIPNFTWAD